MRRSAFTLLELLIVVALVVVLVSATIITLRAPLSAQRLRTGCDVLRTTLANARNHAIRHRRAYAVAVQADSDSLSVAPWSPIGPTQDTAGVETISLPEGIVVHQLSVPTLTLNDAVGATELQQILFYPDGTSMDASVTLRNENSEGIRIQLHGITCSCSLGGIGSIESNSPP
ncbi:MAG: GspH/FimT family pseudopilin [Planctomycetota bacterium]|nr:GspH/FimT family pseudopilin [Planctomycetota bacterium]